MKHEDLYVPFEEKDELYFGCEKVIRSEWHYIRKLRDNQASPAVEEEPAAAKRDRITWWCCLRRVVVGLIHARRAKPRAETVSQQPPADPAADTPPPDLSGIALSGGGIRSASYCLGVLQGLAYGGWLKKLDYLSTVSGGGYIGGALTWFLHQTWEGPHGEQITFGLDRSTFPFGSYPMVGMKDPRVKAIYKGLLLRHIRQHANYLRPGHGVNLWSLVGVLLSNTLFAVFVYGGALVVVLWLCWFLFDPLSRLNASNSFIKAVAQWLLEVKEDISVAGALGAVSAALFLLMILISAVVSLLPRTAGTGYEVRRYCIRATGVVLFALSFMLLVSVIPSVKTWIGSLRLKPISGLPEVDISALAGSVSSLIGGVLSMWAFFQAGKQKPKVPTAVPVALGAFATIFGVLLLAYSVATQLQCVVPSPLRVSTVTCATSPAAWAWLVAGAVFAFLLIFPNLNYLSMHRYYRDRLMETFTPDLPDAIQMEGAMPGAPKSADSTGLHKMRVENPKPGQMGPYPIINCNIVLVSSEIPKFRGRGGDNFIFTPNFCGSNATGWCESRGEASPYKEMTLPTAVAISGAAINSNTGSGGEGLTRSAWLSFLMGFFNIRLGYWAPNPTPYSERVARIVKGLDRTIFAIPQCPAKPGFAYVAEIGWCGLKIGILWPLRCLRLAIYYASRVLRHSPRAIYPGLTEVFLRANLDENSRLVQLSDGGHFENLGLYELIRRRLRLIIVCDATADPTFAFDDLANAMEKVRADFGALIDLSAGNLGSVMPGGVKKGGASADFAKKGYVVARIIYQDRTQGTLLYLNTTLFKGVSADLYAYRRGHPQFPDEPTSEQFFEERQFEAYRELGYQTAYAMMHDPHINTQADVQATLGPPAIGGG